MGTSRSVAAVGAVLSVAWAAGCQPPTRAETGRYWAHLTGTGSTSAAVTAWLEYKPQTVSSWDQATRGEVRTLPAGSPLEAVELWLSGLAPQTGYDLRLCQDDGTLRCSDPTGFATLGPAPLAWIERDPDHPRHLRLTSGERFIVWGNNYVEVTVPGRFNQLVEEQMYTGEGLALIDADLARLRNLAPPDGESNAIRMHLQLHTFLQDALTPDPEALARYARVIELAEDRGLRVMVTGLNYFYPADSPRWIAEQTDEAAHWATHAVWWNAMAGALRHSPGVFAYDLMNEPYVAGNRVQADGLAWYTTVGPDAYCDYGADPERGKKGTCFGQYITPDPGTRTASQVATAWAAHLRQAIRFSGEAENDARHLITIGVGAFGMSNVFNGSAEVHQHLDFLSPHLYPDANQGQDAIELAAALAALTPDKPIIAGETFSFGPVDRLISNTCQDGTVQGWFGQYDGRRRGDPCPGEEPWGCILYDAWYDVLAEYGPTLRAGGCPERVP